MKNTLLMLFALFALTGTLALGADVTGKWQGTPGSRPPDNAKGKGRRPLEYNLKQSGSLLTGTVATANGDGLAEVKNGKVDGDKVYFELERETTYKYWGKVEGDTMKIKVDSGDGTPGEFVLKKQ